MLRRDRHSRLEGYLQRLFGYAFSLTHDAEQAKDLVHDTAVKALGARQVPGDEPAYRAWLFKILRNSAIDRVRQDRTVSGNVHESISPDDDGPVHWSEKEEVNALAVRIAYTRLTLMQREVLAAVDVAGLTYAEAAELFDIPVGTVMSRISRARSALYKHMQETKDDPKVRFFPLRRRTSSNG